MKEIFLKDYKPFNYIIPEVKLSLDIRENSVFVESFLTIIKNENYTDSELILDGKELMIESISINGNIVDDYIYKDEKLTIKNVPDDFTLHTKVKIDPFNNKSLEGFYKSGNILCSQNEAEGFRRITFFPDRPDIMSKYTVSIEADINKYPLLLSNGNPVNKKVLSENRHSYTWVDPFEKPCYLVAVVAGDLELTKGTFTTCSGREIKLEIYTDHGKGSQSIHAIESLKKINEMG